MSTIISWNVNSFSSKYPFVQLLAKDFNPAILCIQETKLQPSNNIFLKNYSTFRLDNVTTGNAKGGVLIAVSKNFHSEQITLNSPFQAVAARVWFDTPITVCSIYLHHQDCVTSSLMQNLIAQLPAPFILTGDFNAHNYMWGSNSTNNRGAELEDLIFSSNLALLNTGQQTRLNTYTGKYSAIDLTICSSSMVSKLRWSMLEYSYTSDHFPQCIDISTNLPPPTFSPTWKFQNADWDTFAQLIDFSGIENCENATQMAELIQNNIITAALETIPTTTPSKGKYRVPWWNVDCEAAIKKKRKTWRTYNRHPCDENMKNFKLARALARRTIYQAKRSSWQNFVSGINSSVPSSTIWKRIRCIDSKRSFEPIPAIRNDRGEIISAEKDVAEIFADFFRRNTEAVIEAISEESITSIECQNDLMNQDILTSEVKEAIKNLKNSAAGPDRIHPLMLKHLRHLQVEQLTTFFNHIWNHHDFPNQWRLAHIIPLCKPGKDRTLPTSYRPISLTNVICKLIEKIIVKRLHYSLDQKGQLDRFQCGFRPKKSTTDSLIHLSQEILTGFARKQYTISVFFDINKAFDRIRPSTILHALQKLQYGGNIFFFIQNFLEGRLFQIRIGHMLSAPTRQITGTPQGSVLSPLLFILAVNNIQNHIRYPVKHLLYADDLALFVRGNDLQTLQHNLQSTINRLAVWGDEHGLSFAPSKTKVINFTKKRNTPLLQLNLKGEPLLQVNSTRFLGLTFDHTLTWSLHIQELRRKCSQRLNLLKKVNGTSWGADKKCILRIYYSHIRSILDYGSIVYASASESNLKKLDPLQNQALRIATGAFRTSPIASILVESNNKPLALRRNTSLLIYFGQMLTQPDHINSYRICSSMHPKSLGYTASQFLTNLELSIEQLRTEPDQRIQRQLIRDAVKVYWQKIWNEDPHPYLIRTIKPKLEEWHTSYNASRQKEITLTRIRIGHTRLTHSHYILRSEPPECDTCHTRLTITHALNNCSKYTPCRVAIFGSCPYQVYETLGDNTSALDLLFRFLRDTELLSTI